MQDKKFFSALKKLKCSICAELNCPVRNKAERRKEVIVNGTTFVTKCPKDKQGKEDMYTF